MASFSICNFSNFFADKHFFTHAPIQQEIKASKTPPAISPQYNGFKVIPWSIKTCVAGSITVAFCGGRYGLKVFIQSKSRITISGLSSMIFDGAQSSSARSLNGNLNFLSWLPYQVNFDVLIIKGIPAPTFSAIIMS